jgi:hypothetical protein
MRRWSDLLCSIVFVALLAAPALQSWTGFAPVIGLGGVEAVAPARAPRTFEGWFDGALQAEVERSWNRDLGLRDWMVRADNQVRMWLCGEAKRPVVRGAGPWLFSDGYAPARHVYRTQDEASLLAKVHNLKLVQDAFEQRGITFVVLVAPSKSHTLPDLLPPRDAAPLRERPLGYADVFVHAARTHGVRVLDYQQRFREWRVARPEVPLFVPAGVHWSHAAAAHVTADLLDWIESTRGVDVRSLGVEALPARPPTGADRDLLNLANLLDERPFDVPVPAATVRVRPGDAGAPVGILFVGDSFSWPLAAHLAQGAAAAPLAVWYYFRTRTDYVDGCKQPGVELAERGSDLAAALGAYQVVVLLANVSHLRALETSFSDAVLAAYGGSAVKTVSPALRAEMLRAFFGR